MSSHWDEIYDTKEESLLGWYQEEPQPDFGLIDSLNLSKNAKIMIAGAGSSTLIDRLHNEGYSNLIVTDISQSGLSTVQKRIGDNSHQWIVDDLTSPKELAKISLVDLWYDRAVLHFFVEESQRNVYRQLIHSKVKPGGYVILAEFSSSGAERCSGLPVRRYSPPMLQEFLGPQFSSVRFLDFTYVQPSGNPRPFIYGIFRRELS